MADPSNEMPSGYDHGYLPSFQQILSESVSPRTVITRAEDPMSISTMLCEPIPSATTAFSANPNSENPVPNAAPEDVAYPWHESSRPHRYDFERGDRLRQRYEQENPFRSGAAPREVHSSPGPARHSPLTSETGLPAANASFPSTPSRRQRITPTDLPPNCNHNHDHEQRGGQQQQPEQQKQTKQEEEDSQEPKHQTSLCEFSAPCRMTPSPDGMHYRKVVSHVFGRNKASTKLFPSSVWVQYCRKHYQRARYRADQWPFTQCELLQESLNRMEAWGGVESFELILRRRETMRVDDEHEDANQLGDAEGEVDHSVPKKKHLNTQTASSSFSSSGRKRPTAVTAPVPHWLRNRVGRGMSFDNVREIILQVREYMAELRDEEKNHRIQQPVARASGNRTSRLASIRQWRVNLRQRSSRVRFPDIEILPTFRPWVLEAALRQRASSEQPHEPEREAQGDGADAAGHGDQGRDESHGPERDGGAAAVPRAQQAPGAGIGRTGLNRGASRSQRRRSERLFLRMLTRTSERGGVRKPSE